MDAYKDHCVLAIQNNNDESKPYSLIICNNINTIVDCKKDVLNLNFTKFLISIMFSIAYHINFQPTWISLNGTHVIASSLSSFVTWQYSVPKSHSASITNSKQFYTP